MEPKLKSLGSSIVVPSVQELAKEPLISVPPRYIRTDLDQQPMMVNDNQQPQIPVIDLQKLRDPASFDSELSQLGFACKEWGFFQLVNHGVSLSLLDKMRLQVQDFFKLPIEEKKKFWQYPGEIEGFGQSFVVSENQKLDWADRFFTVTQPTHLRKPHLLPNLPLPFREILEAYLSEVNNLTMFLLEQIGKTLNIEPEVMKGYAEGMWQSLRMNYYPPCPQPDKVIGLAPHSDATILTLLLQVGEIEGLQVKKDGTWVVVKPALDTFIVNVGDAMEIITNGIYRSIEHRATVNSLKERLSIAAFHLPSFDCVIGPVPSLTSERTPALFRTVPTEEFLGGLYSRQLRGKSYLDTLRVSK